MFASCMPIAPSAEEIGGLSREACALGFSIKQGRRPHIVYGTKESSKGIACLFFSPKLLDASMALHDPAKMQLTYEKDWPTIQKILEEMRKHVKPLVVRWVGPVKEQTQPHGVGKHVDEGGNVYEGEMVNGFKSGHGRMKFAGGSAYERGTRGSTRWTRGTGRA